MKKLMIAILALVLAALPALAEESVLDDFAVTEEQMIEMCGYALTAPEGAEDVQLYAFPSNEEGIYPLAELRFTFNGIKCAFRAQATDDSVPSDISGLEYEWTETADGDVDGWYGSIRSCADASVITWFDEWAARNYSFAAMTDVTNESLNKMANILYAPISSSEPVYLK